jgi:hypothetical protein
LDDVRETRSEGKGCVDLDYRCAPGVDLVDDLGAVDALQVDLGDAEAGMAELALDDDQWHALACHLDGVRVTEPVWREATPDARLRGVASQLGAHGGV